MPELINPEILIGALGFLWLVGMVSILAEGYGHPLEEKDD